MNNLNFCMQDISLLQEGGLSGIKIPKRAASSIKLIVKNFLDFVIGRHKLIFNDRIFFSTMFNVNFCMEDTTNNLNFCMKDISLLQEVGLSGIKIYTRVVSSIKHFVKTFLEFVIRRHKLFLW